MAAKSRAELKALFQNTLRPDQDDFGDLIDSFPTIEGTESDHVTAMSVGDLQVGTLGVTGQALFPAGAIDPSALDSTKILDPLGQDLGGALLLQIDPGTLEVNGSNQLAVKNSGVPSGSVGTDQLQDGSVTSAKLAGGSVTAAKIVSEAIDTSKLADNAVAGNKLADASVSGPKINASALGVGLDKNPSDQVYVKGNRRVSADGNGVNWIGPDVTPGTNTSVDTTIPIVSNVSLTRSALVKVLLENLATSPASQTDAVVVVTQKDSSVVNPDRIYTSQEIPTIGLGRVGSMEVFVPQTVGYDLIDVDIVRASPGGSPLQSSYNLLIDEY